MVKKSRVTFLLVDIVLGSVLATSLSYTPIRASSPPKHSYIAFALWEGRTSDLYVMTPDGAQWANLTNTPDDIEQFPAWSPDGSQIVFTSNRSGNFDIYIMRIEGLSTVSLTQDVQTESSPAWRPSGDQVAFLGCGAQICLISTDGERLAVFAPRDVSGPITWSPDGRYIAYASDVEEGAYIGNDDIFVLDVEANFAAMTSESSPVPAWFPEAPLNAFPPINITNTPDADEYAPSWSPDGGYFAFLRGHSGSVYVMGIDGSSPRLLPSPEDDGDYPPPASGWPTWAPDGKQVAFTSNAGKVYGNDLYIASVEGTRLKRVTHLPEEQGVRIAEPAWSPWLDEPLDLDWQPTPWSVSEE